MHERPTRGFCCKLKSRFPPSVLVVLVLSTVLLSICSCDNSLSVQVARKRAPFPLYLPSQVPSDIDPTPTILEYTDVYHLEVYYYPKQRQDLSPVLRFEVSSFSGMHSTWPWDPYTGFPEVAQLPNGHVVGVLDPERYECWRMLGPGESTCKYNTSEFLGLMWPGEEAWYTLYSTLSLTETLAVIASMQPAQN